MSRLVLQAAKDYLAIQPPPGPRPVMDAIVSTMVLVVRNAQDINQTGYTWADIELIARAYLYDSIDRGNKL